MFDSSICHHIERIIASLLQEQLYFACAESCSGGLLAALFTEIAGSSKVFDRGFVTYSNEAKKEMLGVKQSTLEQFGAVSEKTAIEMVKGVMQHSNANLAIAITGIAGPHSDDSKKPVGLVYIAIAFQGRVKVRKFHFSGDRTRVRKATIIAALEMIEYELLR